MRNIKILAVILMGLFLIIVLIVWITYRSRTEEYSERKKTVICVKTEDTENRVMVVCEINLNDCRENLISYNEDKQTLLYINQKDQVIEKNINREIADDTVLLKHNNLHKEEISSIHNLQYMSIEENISFIFNNNLYFFDCKEGQSYKIVNGCIGSTWCNTYWMQSTEEIYFIDYDENQQQKNLYFQNKQQERRLVEKGIESFCVSSDGTRLYCVQGYTVPNIFGFNTKYRIIEINLLQGTNCILQEISSDNFILRDVDNKYLLYIEESNEKKTTKVFQLNLQSGKSKCIYQTNNKVIGIVS